VGGIAFKVGWKGRDIPYVTSWLFIE
jgi:hypothetical protein